MKKKTTRVFAVLLSLAMLLTLFSASFTASAAADDVYNAYLEEIKANKTDEIYPTIVLPGISQSQSYLADENGEPVVNANGTELSGGLMIIDDENLVGKAMNTLFVPAVSTLLAQRDRGITDAIYKFMCDLFYVQKSNPDGTTAENIKTVTFNTSVAEMSEKDRNDFFRALPMQEYAEIVGNENLYLFAFPLLGNPIDNGKNLQDYIDFVKADSGKDKVNLCPVSLGGTVLTAWANSGVANFGDVDKIINIVSLLDGADVIADFIARDFILEDQFIHSDFFPKIMKEMNGDATVGYILNIALRILPRPVFEKALTRAVDGILETFILNSPQFWAMVPSGRYPALAQRYMSSENNPERAALREKTDAFYASQLALRDNLTDMHDNYGVEIYNICGYNLDYSVQDYNFFGIMKSTLTTNSDAIIGVNSTSLGANYAPAGTQFDSAYLAAADADYISPDKGVDASSCLFRDNVWFYYNTHHEVGRCDLVIKLATRIVTGEIKDVDSDSRFPQFITGRKSNDLYNRIKDSKAIFADPSKVVNSDKMPAFEAAYDEAVNYFYSVYEGDQTKTNELAENLKKAIAEVTGSAYNPPADKTQMTFTEKIFKFFSDMVFKIFGNRGFFDFNAYN